MKTFGEAIFELGFNEAATLLGRQHRKRGGAMTRQEKLEFVRQSLRRYEGLLRKHGDAADYVAFVLSCPRAEAQALIAAARQQEGAVSE